MTIAQYRQEHVEFHQRRVDLFMLAAETVRGFMRYYDTDPDTVFAQIVRGLVHEARTENQIVRWWKHMSDEQLQRQIDFWICPD